MLFLLNETNTKTFVNKNWRLNYTYNQSENSIRNNNEIKAKTPGSKKTNVNNENGHY